MNILFLCAGNVFRNQLAEYFLRELTKKHNVQSAGINFKKKYDVPLINIYKKKFYQLIKLFEKHGFKFEKQKPKKITKEMLDSADKIILILEDKKLIPEYLKNNKKLIFWEVEDGVDENRKPKSLEKTSEIIITIKKLVKGLVKAINQC